MNYQTLTVQADPDPDLVEVRELRGQKYLVAPVVAVSEGVLNGGFLPYEEIEKSAPGWNAQPLTVTHPHDGDGNFLPAAADTETLERFKIGSFLNVSTDDDGRKLTGELWIQLLAIKWLVENDDELGDLAEQTVAMLRDGDPLEVSTGYWHGSIEQAGEFDGHEFEAVQVDVLPDHLATLPNAEGACNWDGDRTESGCGAPRPDATSNLAANASPNALDYPGVEWKNAPPTAQAGSRERTFASNSDGPSTCWVCDRDATKQSEDPPYELVCDEHAGGLGGSAGEIHDASKDPRANVNSNAPVVETAQTEATDLALHRDEYDPASIDAANLLDQARTPEFDGTDASEWSKPTLSEFVEAWGYDDVETVGDLTTEQREAVASTTLLGDPEAETFDELVFFPVVDPRGRLLNENALDAVLSGRGAQADISDDQLTSARGIARDLLEDEFGRDLDENVASLLGLVDQKLATVRQSFMSRLGFDVDDRVDCGCGGDCDDCDDPSDTETTGQSDPSDGSNQDRGSTTNMGDNPHDFDDDRLEAIVNASDDDDLDVETLRETPKLVVEQMEASLDLDGQSGSGDGDGSGNVDDDKLDTVLSRLDEMEERFEEQEQEEAQRLIDEITSQSRFEEDDLETLGIADDVEALETFAEKQGVQTNTTPNYGGRAAGTGGADEDVDLESASVGGAFASMDADAAGGD